MNEQIVVFVSCQTYNQSKYIKDALDGFCMQQTDFPFVCAVFDDASTDGEPEVLKQYLVEHFDLVNKSVVREEETDDYVRIFAQHKDNKNCYFAVVLLKYNHYQIKKSKEQYVQEWRDIARYYAVCEGDDYWIDPLKLQKQVDFMESHPEHSLCFHAHTNLYGDKRVAIRRYNTINEFVPVEDIILGDGGFMATASMLFRHELVKDIPEWRKKAKTGDYALALHLAVVGKVGYLPDIMSCYRVSTEGSWTQRISKDDKMFQIWYKGGMEMFNGFDSWTGGEYHKQVKKMKKKLWETNIKRLIHKII